MRGVKKSNTIKDLVMSDFSKSTLDVTSINILQFLPVHIIKCADNDDVGDKYILDKAGCIMQLSV